MENFSTSNPAIPANNADNHTEANTEAMSDDSYRNINRMMSVAASRRLLNMMQVDITR
jgi:hypothetical protein